MQANKSGMMDCSKQIFTTRGIPGFYRGAAMPLLSHLAKRPFQFPISEYLKQRGYNNYLIGALIGPAGTIFGTPLQILKIQSQTSTNSMKKIFINVYQNRRFAGFYKGFIPTLIKDCLFGASFMGHYYTLRDYVGSDTTPKNFFNGATAHCLTWFTLMPIDYIKTNIQKSNEKSEALKIISKNLKKDGPKFFGKG